MSYNHQNQYQPAEYFYPIRPKETRGHRIPLPTRSGCQQESSTLRPIQNTIQPQEVASKETTNAAQFDFDDDIQEIYSTHRVQPIRKPKTKRQRKPEGTAAETYDQEERYAEEPYAEEPVNERPLDKIERSLKEEYERFDYLRNYMSNLKMDHEDEYEGLSPYVLEEFRRNERFADYMSNPNRKPMSEVLEAYRNENLEEIRNEWPDSSLNIPEYEEEDLQMIADHEVEKMNLSDHSSNYCYLDEHNYCKLPQEAAPEEPTNAAQFDFDADIQEIPSAHQVQPTQKPKPKRQRKPKGTAAKTYDEGNLNKFNIQEFLNEVASREEVDASLMAEQPKQVIKRKKYGPRIRNIKVEEEPWEMPDHSFPEFY